jgi:hypothetical protein
MKTALMAAALLAALPLAQAAPPKALLYTEDNHPRAAIPGFNPGLAIDGFSIGILSYSPNGRRWVISGVARNGEGGTRPTVVLAGDETGIRQAVVQNIPMPGSGLAFSTSPTSLAINDAGDFAFGSFVTGGTSSDRVFVARCRAATGLCDVAARQNSVIPGLGSVVPGATGERYGSVTSVVGVLPDGRVVMLAENTTGPLSTLQDELLLVEGNPVQVLAQAGVTVPSGQAGGGAEVLINLDRRFGMSADGSNWIIGGQLNGTGNPDVFVRNGAVVLQRGVAVPGLVGDISTQRVAMNGTGHWWVQGTSTLGQRFLIVNGALRLANALPVPAHPSRGLVQAIFGSAVNERGDLTYAISTSTGEALLMVERAGGRPSIVLDGESILDVGIYNRPPVLYSSPFDTAKPMYFAGDRLWFLTRALSFSVRTPTEDGLFELTLPMSAPLLRSWGR